MALKKILLVISDFHLSAGKFRSDGSINPFENFFQDNALIDLLKFYSSGRYRERNLELVINGDFFEFVDTYLDDVDPFFPYEEDELTKLKMIIAGHPEVFQALGKFARLKRHSIRFITGNHDQSLMFEGVREYLAGVIGGDVRFSPFEYRVHDILIQHGNQMEGIFGAIRPPYFLKDAAGRPYLNYTEGTRFHIQTVIGAKKIFPLFQRVRPYKDFLRWMWLFRRTLFFRLWFHTLLTMGRLLFPLREIFQNIQKVKRLLWWLGISDIDWLLTENKDILDSARIHICGHSHYYKYRNLGQHKIYINTGTWTPVINLDLQSLGKANRLPYCYIEVDTKQNTKAFLKDWKGTSRPDMDLFA